MPKLLNFLEILKKTDELAKVKKRVIKIRNVFMKLLKEMEEKKLPKTKCESKDRSLARNLKDLLLKEKELCQKVHAGAAQRINAGGTRDVPRGKPSNNIFLNS